MFSLAVLATTYAVVFPVELPDKTLVATLVLTTRYRPVPVLAGVSLAFAVQSAIAVTAGGLLGLLPHRLVAALAAALFALGAVVLLRGDDGAEGTETADTSRATGSWRVALTSFGVLFAAEWGDASQLASAALAARYDQPLAVFLGAWLALVSVATLAVLLGRQVRHRIPLRLVRRLAAAVFVTLAVLGTVEAIRG